MSDPRWAIEIDREDIATAAIVDDPAGALAPGEIEVRIDRFAITANNVTYAALGKPVGLFPNGKGYWDFFSPGGEGPARLPVWGFATVTRSAAEGVAEGETVDAVANGQARPVAREGERAGIPFLQHLGIAARLDPARTQRRQAGADVDFGRRVGIRP